MPHRQNQVRYAARGATDVKIIDEARALAKTYKKSSCAKAQEIIRLNVYSAIQHNRDTNRAREQFLRNRYLRLLRNQNGSTPAVSTSEVDEDNTSATDSDVILHDSRGARIVYDPANHALWNIKRFSRPARMRPVEKIPKYQSWIPVTRDYFVRDEAVEPFYPYYGDSKEQLALSRETYLELRKDQMRRERDLSDGDVTGSGSNASFEIPDDDPPAKLHFFAARLRREAQRATTLDITSRYGTSPVVWYSLADALNVKDITKLHAIANVARRRLDRRTAQATRRARQRRVARETARFLRKPLDEPEPEGLTGEHMRRAAPDVLNPILRHFCTICAVFACELHDGKINRPIKTIPDRTRNERRIALENRTVKPCSRRCYLVEAWLQDPVSEDTQGEWTYEEGLILHEGQALFGNDPCRLAVVVGSRSCRQVSVRLQKNVDLAEDASTLAKRRMRDEEEESESGGESDDDKPLTELGSAVVGVAVKSAAQRRSKRVGKRKQKKAEKPNVVGEKPQFYPCDHEGPCTPRNGCECAEKDVRCEAACGCRTGRFYSGKAGMYWQDCPTGTRRCGNRHKGCRCRPGECRTDQCECYAAEIACNPDVCNDCGCAELPEVVGTRERRCESSAIIDARHRRVFVGRSEVHGYGLFAGEDIGQGQLIGPYSGRLMPTALLDEVLRISQAVKSTYAFTLTTLMSVDAGLVGSKVKFINHSYEAEKINCQARVERVRGECRIAIRAGKRIRAGQEIFIDYHIVHEEGNEWLMEPVWGQNKQDGDDDDGQSSAGGRKGGRRAMVDDEETDEDDIAAVGPDSYHGDPSYRPE